MKIIKTILYGTLVFFILCCGVIVLCAVKPETSTRIANALKLNENEDYALSPVPGKTPEQSMGNTENQGITDVILPEETEESDPLIMKPSRRFRFRYRI